MLGKIEFLYYASKNAIGSFFECISSLHFSGMIENLGSLLAKKWGFRADTIYGSSSQHGN
ncbi:MAG: hypothetical protein IPH22_05300 [Nitrosomonas sp.]|nr:hypothetical protein [Nitrosomonas sp.]